MVIFLNYIIRFVYFRNMKIAFHTLGCKLNFSETSFIANNLKDENFEISDFSDKSDVYVLLHVQLQRMPIKNVNKSSIKLKKNHLSLS